MTLWQAVNALKEGDVYKRQLWVRVLGWISVIGLTFLNLYNLPQTYEGFGIWSKGLSDVLAWISIVAIVVLLALSLIHI